MKKSSTTATQESCLKNYLDLRNLWTRLARDEYYFYCEYVSRGRWRPAKHLELVCHKLQQIESGEINRLMVFMPPRHGKSATVTETFPSYFIGKKPSRRVIEVSYGFDLAEKFGYSNKKKIAEFGKEIFGVTLNTANSSKSNWGIAGNVGGMISAGYGGSITGFGADCLIIDDPVRNRQDADSETYRARIWDEWQNTLLTRLHPNGAVIIILTRWHEKDLAGRLLEEDGRIEDGGKWHVISLSAEAEEKDLLEREIGEPLWPEQGYDKKWLEEKKKEVGSHTFAALYQQRPRPKDSQRLFKREWFQIVDGYPQDGKGVRFWDLAATEPVKGKDPDYTAGCKMIEKKGQYWIVDMQRTRSTPLNVENLIKQTAELDGRYFKVRMEQEGGSSGVNTIDHYRRTVLKGYNFKGIKSTGSKELRATPLSAAAEAGNVFIVRAAWNKEFLDEVDVFSTGLREHDDQVDAASGAFAEITFLGNTEAIDYYKIINATDNTKSD